MTQVNLDEDGYINESYYLNACLDIINRGIQDRGRDADHITTNQLMTHLNDCYDTLFKPKQTQLYNEQCSIPYNTTNIQRLINIYLKICDSFSVLPSVYTFSRFTGIQEDTVEEWVTGGKMEITKHRKGYVQNRLNDTTIGVIALANNDIDTSLLYTRQNIVDHATVKKALSFSDLRQIAQRGTDGDD
jgi:hypothetical protein